MESLSFLVVALGILGFALISGRVQRSIITGPMVFVVFGFVVARGLGVVELEIEDPLIQTLAELTLVLVLFTDASRIDLGLLRREHTLPVRLLSVALPLCIALGTLLAILLFPELTVWEGAVLAAMLAPTDAALGQAVVSLPLLPVKIRQALNVESGLNDGIALPVFLLLLACAGAAEHTAPVSDWVRFATLQLVLGPLVGIAVGYFGGKLVDRGSRSGWINRSFQDLSALGLSILAFALAELVGGNGFIAAFTAGLTLGNTSRAICSCLYEFAEAEGQLLTLLIFTVFGAVMVPLVFDQLSWQVIVYAAASLTIIRMLPTALSLVGAHLQPDTVLFLGWFGPRGIATILFALLMLERAALPGGEQILVVAMTTVLFSVFAHGVSAYPGAHWYAARAEAMQEEPGMAELESVSEMPVRVSFRRS
jgi:NhaP-type Na+/H+ or K+/H+ antiporter